MPDQSPEEIAKREFEKARAAYLETLDDELKLLHGLLTAQADDEKIGKLCWEILRNAEGKLLRTKNVNEQGEIITLGWEAEWQQNESVSWGGPVGFGDIRRDRVAKCRYTVFEEMIRLVKWTEGSHGKRKKKAQLSEAICDYLERRGKKIPEEPAYDYVNLNQMAAIVNRSKRTLERAKTRQRNPLPHPDTEGGGGKPDEWLWQKVKPWLEQEFKKTLPKHFPAARFHR